MKTYLVEAYSEKVKFEENSNIISLTPEACYQLDKAGIKYSILEDYCELNEVVKEEKTYFISQLNWVNKFDNLLFNIFPYARKIKLKLATQYYYSLKTTTDPLILRSKILRGFIEKVSPEEIIYISKKSNKEKIDFTLLFTKSESLFSRIIPIICQKHSIPFHRIILENNEINYIDFSSSHRKGLIKKVKNVLKKNRCIRSIYSYCKMGLISNIFFNLFKQDKLNLFFLKFGYGMEDLIKDVLKDGNKAFMKKPNGEITYYSPLGIKNYLRIKKNSSHAKMEIRFQEGGKEIEEAIKKESEVLKWINEQCGIDVSDIVLPRIRYFIEVICPEILSLMEGYVKFYKNNHIDFVITPQQWEVEDYISIATTKYSKGTKSVCIHHGNDVFNAPGRDFMLLKPYDIYLSTDEEHTQSCERIDSCFNYKTKIIPSFSYRLNQFSLLAQKGRRRKNKKRTVIYIPTSLNWDNYRIEAAYYEDAWYYKWQKLLLEFFASQNNFHFIWKVLPASNKIYDPIPNLIQDKEYKDIEYAANSFYYWITKADLALLDYPSTAFYEAAVAKLPVMSLYNTNFMKIREGAKKIFGKSLQPFSTISEGIEKVGQFLRSNPDDFVVSLPLANSSVLKILKELKLER